MKKNIPPYKAEIDADYARNRLSYNPETGEIHWKHRSASDFKTTRSANAWNTKHAGKPAFCTIHKPKASYSALVGRLNYFMVAASHMAWLLHYGKWPRSELDHINGNPFDNRISNLRDVTRQENNMNQSRSRANTSGQTGVYYHRKNKKWCAYINVFGKMKHLGSFESFEEAVKTRLEADRKYDFHPNHGREPFANIAAAIASVVRTRITNRARECQHAA